MRLYTFFNSSTSYRVRIALALKGLDYESVPVNIRRGEQSAGDFLGPVNASAGVPVLEIDGLRIAQSMAIIDYLDRRFPEPRLIPETPEERARELSFANVIACDIHPLNNLRVLKYLDNVIGVDGEAKQQWYQHWIDEGLAAAERMLAAGPGGRYCFGDTPSIADCCLVPQIANARRMKCTLDAYPRLLEAHDNASSHPAFVQAAPENQPDFQS